MAHDEEQQPIGEDGTSPTIDNTSMSQLIAEQFSFDKAIGGVRGLVESVLPGLVFVVVYLVTKSLPISLVSSSAVAVVLVAVRLIQRTPITQAMAGLVGVAIGVVWAWWTGRASDYFAGGLLLNAGYLIALVISIVVQWPIVGIIVGLLRGQGFAWQKVPQARRIYAWATWLWVGMFGLRLLVQAPLYFRDDVGWLGTAKLAMGVPLWALTLWVTWLMVRGITIENSYEGDEPRE